MRRTTDERGIALIAALLVTMMMSALVAGFLVMVNADQVAGGIERDQTQAYAAAHAGVEKLTADLGPLFLTNFNPSEEDLNDLETADRQPQLPGITFVRPDGASGYDIRFTDDDGDGTPDVADPNGTQIAAGPYQGLVGLITPYEVEVTARTAGNAEVRMRRTLQTIAIPVFQFGLFSENDLSFHAGDDFSFGGRVHSNANIFIASVGGAVLTLSDRVTAVRDVIRTHFTNGRSTSSAGYTGTVRMAKAQNCPASSSACRNLGMNEGSLVGNVGSAKNSNWANLSVGSYNSYIRNGDTGGRRLDLPLVSDGAEPIDLIRRPRPTAAGAEPVSLANQRFFNLATLRILLSDTAAELEGLPGVEGAPVSLEAGSLSGAAGGYPLATSTGNIAMGYRSAGTPTPTPLIGGYILINRQDADGDWTDVTNEILSLGISGRNLSNGTINSPGSCPEIHPDAVIRLQRLKDVPAAPVGPTPQYCNSSTDSQNYWPNTLYDPREGLLRDDESTSQNLLYLGGVMHYLELDVANFKKWIEGTTGTSGPGSMDVTGYVVYFSDRRNNKNVAGLETGEFGWEDIVNPSSSSGAPNGNLNGGEDMNGNGTLQDYGRTPRINYTMTGTGTGTWGATDINTASTLWSTASRVNKVVARTNRAVFFRRALKVVNGGLGSLPSNGLQGLTIASENPVYVQGNFNACGSPTQSCTNVATAFGPTGDAHRSAAVLADSVTLLSRSWNDLNSFNSPHNPGGRDASTTWYRIAIISGKGVTFQHPGNGEFANFGSDGGAHNFLRFLENWDSSSTIYYRGSMVSLFTSRQGVGTWKCCQNVYTPPDRGAFFDTEFLLPSLLPPRTPMFRDINTLTFRQILRPTQ